MQAARMGEDDVRNRDVFAKAPRIGETHKTVTAGLLTLATELAESALSAGLDYAASAVVTLRLALTERTSCGESLSGSPS
jgi:hypothetical protein